MPWRHSAGSLPTGRSSGLSVAPRSRTDAVANGESSRPRAPVRSHSLPQFVPAHVLPCTGLLSRALGHTGERGAVCSSAHRSCRKAEANRE
jgi:hypothetical protein